MNRREIFDTVNENLLRQNKKAQLENGDCKYLTDNGLRCAIGWLIPDGHPALHSSQAVPCLLAEHQDLWELWGIRDDGDSEFLEALQDVHDDYLPRYWKAKLLLVEEEYV